MYVYTHVSLVSLVQTEDKARVMPGIVVGEALCIEKMILIDISDLRVISRFHHSISSTLMIETNERPACLPSLMDAGRGVHSKFMAQAKPASHLVIRVIH